MGTLTLLVKEFLRNCPILNLPLFESFETDALLEVKNYYEPLIQPLESEGESYSMLHTVAMAHGFYFTEI